MTTQRKKLFVILSVIGIALLVAVVGATTQSACPLPPSTCNPPCKSGCEQCVLSVCVPIPKLDPQSICRCVIGNVNGLCGGTCGAPCPTGQTCRVGCFPGGSDDQIKHLVSGQCQAPCGTGQVQCGDCDCMPACKKGLTPCGCRCVKPGPNCCPQATLQAAFPTATQSELEQQLMAFQMAVSNGGPVAQDDPTCCDDSDPCCNVTCDGDQTCDPNSGECVCPDGSSPDANGECNSEPLCPDGVSHPDANGHCPCDDGSYPDANGNCPCPNGQVRDPNDPTKCVAACTNGTVSCDGGCCQAGLSCLAWPGSPDLFSCGHYWACTIEADSGYGPGCSSDGDCSLGECGKCNGGHCVVGRYRLF